MASGDDFIQANVICFNDICANIQDADTHAASSIVRHHALHCIIMAHTYDFVVFSLCTVAMAVPKPALESKPVNNVSCLLCRL